MYIYIYISRIPRCLSTTITILANRIESDGDSQAALKALIIIPALPYSSQLCILGFQMGPLHVSSHLILTLVLGGEYILTFIF